MKYLITFFKMTFIWCLIRNNQRAREICGIKILRSFFLFDNQIFFKNNNTKVITTNQHITR